jgi:hypothetical protein
MSVDHELDVPGVTRTPPRELDPLDRVAWERLDRLMDRHTELLSEIEELKATLRERLGRGEFAVNGEKVFSIIGQVRWNEEQARRVLPAEIIERLEITVLSAHAAGELLAKETYRQCQVPHGRDRVVRTRDNGEKRRRR